MRWPFRRRAVPAPMPPRLPVVPLTTVSDRYRPAITGFGLPDVAGTRPMLVPPSIVPGPRSPRGRVYGTVVAHHPDPVARRGRLPSLRHLFAGQPSQPPNTPQPWAVRVIDRPTEQLPEPSSFDPPTNAPWPEPHQVPEPTTFEPFGAPEPSDEDWLTSDAIADLQAVLAAARAPEPDRPTPPAPPATSQPIRRLTLAESRRRGITSAQPLSTSPPADDIAEPAPQPVRDLPESESAGSIAEPAPQAVDDQPASVLAGGIAGPDPQAVADRPASVAAGGIAGPAPESRAVVDHPASEAAGSIAEPTAAPQAVDDHLAFDPDRHPVEKPTVQPHLIAPPTNIDPEPPMPLDQTGTAPDPADIAPDPRGTARGQAGTARDRTGTAHDETGSAPDQAGAAPDPTDIAADRTGIARGQAGTRRGPAGTAPGQAGTTPDQTGTAAGPAGTAPDQTGTTVSQAGTAPDQTGTAAWPAGTPPARGRVTRLIGRPAPDWPVAPTEDPAPTSGAERPIAGRGSLAPELSVPGAARPDSPAPRSVVQRPMADRGFGPASDAEPSVAGRGSSTPERSAVGPESSMPERSLPASGVERPWGPDPSVADDAPFAAPVPDLEQAAATRDPAWPPTPDAEPDPLMPDVVLGPPQTIPAARRLPPPTFDPPPRLGLGRPLPTGMTRLVTPPPDLAAAVQSSYGIDVSATPIHRGPVTTARAAALSATAFTERGEVFLPDQLGPLTAPAARAGLAHELTHVAQQRILGADLPAEWTPAGQALEQHAVAVERHVRNGQQTAPAPPPMPAWPEMSTSDSIQRQPNHDGPVLSWTAPVPPDVPPSPPDELAEYRDRLVALCGQRLANLDDSTDLDELAERIYHRLRDMLRGELLVDRERAGLLTDFR